MVELLGHRQPKGAATAKLDLQPPRHISTLLSTEFRGWFDVIRAFWAEHGCAGRCWLGQVLFLGDGSPYPRCLSACRGQHWMSIRGPGPVRR